MVVWMLNFCLCVPWVSLGRLKGLRTGDHFGRFCVSSKNGAGVCFLSSLLSFSPWFC